jgi:hypothetical protein
MTTPQLINAPVTPSGPEVAVPLQPVTTQVYSSPSIQSRPAAPPAPAPAPASHA